MSIDASPFLPDGARWLDTFPGVPDFDDVPPLPQEPTAPTSRPQRAPQPAQGPDNDADQPSHISEFRERILAELRLRAEYGDAAIGGEELGFSELDEELIVEAGRLMVIGAREGVGKTAWALQSARYVASRINPLTGRGGTTVYYITEMSVQQAVERVVVSFAQLQMRQLKKGVTPDVIAAVEKAFDLLERSGLHIRNVAGWDIDAIVADARLFKGQHEDLRAVFVDNLTGVGAAREFRNRAQWEQWGDVVGKLNTLSMADKGIAVPVILLAHLKRGDKQNPSREPDAQSFAGSDAINRWASMLVLIHERSPEERSAAGDPDAQAARMPATSAVGFGGGFGGGGSPFAKSEPFEGSYGDQEWTSSDGKDVWKRSEIGASDSSCSHTFIVVKNRDGRRFRADLNFIGAQMRFTDPNGRTIRPYEMPDAEPVARTQFRAAMAALGDL